MRNNFGTAVPWEATVGYSRAVRIGNIIEVSGTVSVLNGKPYGINDPYLQTKRILEIISYALAHYGASFDDVIRTRIYVTDIKFFDQVGKAHGEVFKDIRPATSMVEVSALITPDYLVEIEASAVLDEEES